VSALYEKGLIHHVGMLAELEDELCNWVPGEGLPSPNRLDGLVWALTELMLTPQPSTRLNLAPAIDPSLLQRPIAERATRRAGARRFRDVDGDPAVPIPAALRRRWGLDDDADEDY
jgi:hypothetical protein